MLRRLLLRDFVLVEALELDLEGPGFTVLSGETGAGKSILIDALKLALGERGDAGVLRPGATRAEIGAEFDTPSAMQGWLEEQGFEAGEALLLRRQIDSQGRSRAWINGSAATLGQLRELAAQLVDIHGQHAWQGLTRADTARDLLDAYAGAQELAVDCARAWRAWRDADDALKTAQAESESAAALREQLAEQLAEFDQLAPQTGEWEQLNAEQHALAHGAELLQALQQAQGSLDDDELGALRTLQPAAQALAAASRIDPRQQALVDQLEAARSLLRELVHDIAAAAARVDLDPARLAELDTRMAAWTRLARKHKVTAVELPQLGAAWREQLNRLDQGADLQALQARLAQARAALEASAKALSRARAEAAPRLSQGVAQLMQQLGMQGGSFEVALRALSDLGSSGAETVELLVAGHPGAALRPLGKIASGGELSRIALALAAVTSAQQPVDTLIFDEVDAGIGGAVAHTVGQLLRRLGRQRQVLAVTHLAQVAACAEHHLQVSKQAGLGATSSRIERMDASTRVGEIARMLGGDTSSAVAAAHAAELLRAAATQV